MLRAILIYINQHYPRYEHLELNPCLIKSALLYQNLYQKYFKKRIDLLNIIHKFNLNLFFSDVVFETRSKVLKNHFIFFNAFEEVF